MTVLKCNKKFGVWQALVLMCTGGVCYFTAEYLDDLIKQIQEVESELSNIEKA